MSKRVVLNFIFLMFPLTISSEPLLLTPPFYSIKDTKPINKLTINTTQPTFYIIVPESYTLPSDRKQHHLLACLSYISGRRMERGL